MLTIDRANQSLAKVPLTRIAANRSVLGTRAEALVLDRCQGCDWQRHFASPRLACYFAVLFDLGVLLAVNAAKSQDDELTEFCFNDLVNVEGHF